MDTNATTPGASPSDPPKKYIRTFEGDMTILKEGGIPDLAPLMEKETEETVPQPPATPAAETAPPLNNPQGGLSGERSAEQNALAEIPRPNLPQTYAADFSKRIKDTNASMATVLAAEQDAAPQTAPQKLPKSNRLLIILSAVLLLIGAGGAYYAYSHYQTVVAPVVVQTTVSSPIFVDEHEVVSGTSAAFSQAIVASIAKPLTTDGVRLLSLPASTTADTTVFSVLSLPAPDILQRNINTNGSMAGVVRVGSSQSLFFILSVTSYSDTFAGMLLWEPTMLRNMNQLFPPYPAPAPIVATTTVASTTSKTASTTVVKTPVKTAAITFHDEAVNNHDVRVYRDAQNKTVLLYGYWNRTTLVIARDQAAFTEIINRLATSRTQQ